MTITEFCGKHHACAEGLDWALATGEPDMAALWNRADIKPEWAIWIATREGVLTDRDARLFACLCADRAVALAAARYDAAWDAALVALAASRYASLAAASAASVASAASAACDKDWDAAWDASRDAALDAQADYLRKNFTLNFAE